VETPRRNESLSQHVFPVPISIAASQIPVSFPKVALYREARHTRRGQAGSGVGTERDRELIRVTSPLSPSFGSIPGSLYDLEYSSNT
jgi:hypothetical protein